MIPSFVFRFSLSFPTTQAEYSDIVDRVRLAVGNVLSRSIGAFTAHAPGRRLKSFIVSESSDTPDGKIGGILAPFQFQYTLPPGTVRHFIPIGADLSSAAGVQKRRGYPMRFYWERVGHWVSRWSVDHPGYRGDPWDVRAMAEIEPVVESEMQSVWDYIQARWGGGSGSRLQLTEG